ncbi:MAG: nickel-dependent lactate racemase [Deltaproteobacteria bacterium]|jgi:nickel-dependent lactate racemase|nr:nickel-dependent lactate racemase [Deltaproteobacteria bacterium]
MAYELAYGKSRLSFDLPAGVAPTIIRPGDKKGLSDPLGETRRVLAAPTGCPPLLELLKTKKPGKIVVVVNDITRPTPYSVMFPPLLEVFAAAGIKDEQVTLVIATGIHDPHTDAQNLEVYGPEIVKRFKIINHDGMDKDNLVHMGRFDSGYDFVVNRMVVEADFLLTLGVVMPHYFAGYSGGRKSILPGLCAKDTVQLNHARMVELMDALPPIDQNPVSNEMIEAAKLVGVDFTLNVVTNDAKELVCVTAGDIHSSWRKAVDISASMFEVPFEKPVDICVTCACGRPRDINVYQAQKALDHADRITRPGGTIVLAAECPEKWGENVFEEWIRRRWDPAKVMREIKANFVLGGHKAYGFAKVAHEKDVLLVSSLNADESTLIWAKKIATVQEGVNMAAAKHGPHASWAYMPDGALSLPVRK